MKFVSSIPLSIIAINLLTLFVRDFYHTQRKEDFEVEVQYFKKVHWQQSLLAAALPRLNEEDKRRTGITS